MRINYNMSAMIAKAALDRNSNALAGATKKLSTGYKINSAKDDAAGYAISRKINAQIRGLESAAQTANDGVSIVEIADGALSEVHEMLQRLNELAVKGATGSLTDSDRSALQAEMEQLTDEIDRIGGQTEYNGQPLFDGTYDLRGYTDTYGVTVTDYSDAVPAGTYTITISGIGSGSPSATLDAVDATAGSNDFINNAKLSVEGNVVTITDSRGKDIVVEYDESKLNGQTSVTVDLDITGIGDLNVQIGANEGQSLGMRIPTVTLKSLGVDGMDFTTMDGCKSAMDAIQEGIDNISKIRSRLGAYQNRLESTVSTIDVSTENMTSAYSRIVDVNMASEMTKYYNYQVLVQAGTSVLAQANSQPEQVLQLLQ